MATTKTLQKIHIFPDQASYNSNSSAVGDNDIYLIRDSAWGVTGSLQDNGYVKLPNGLIIQWGSKAFSSSLTSETFPTTFASECYTMAGSADNAASGNFAITDITKSGFKGASGNGTIYWIAIGK